MKKLGKLLRIHSIPAIQFDGEEAPELDNLRRVQPTEKAFPDNAPEPREIAGSEPKDAAKQLWCSAGHF